MCICIKNICINIYYCFFEMCNKQNKKIQILSSEWFIDEERGLVYYNQLPENYDYQEEF